MCVSGSWLRSAYPNANRAKCFGAQQVGVYRGKSFLPLYLLLASSRWGEAGAALEREAAAPVALAIDCFEQQQWNVDNSGEGDEGESPAPQP